MKSYTLFHLEILAKLQKYIHEISKSSPPELLGQFNNIYNHNFAQMYSLNWTGFSGERFGPWASCLVCFLSENRTIFLVGPTVVSSSGGIHFEAIYPIISGKDTVDDAKWINNSSQTVINFNDSGCDKNTLVREQITQTVRIPKDKKHAGNYRIIFNDKHSNNIDVILDGMFFLMLILRLIHSLCRLFCIPHRPLSTAHGLSFFSNDYAFKCSTQKSAT